MQLKKVAVAVAGAVASVKATKDTDPLVTNVAVVHEIPAVSVSTVLSTSYATITSCGPEVEDCPVTTSVVVGTTTLCPVTLTSVSMSASTLSGPADSGVIPPLSDATSSTEVDAITAGGSSSSIASTSTSTITYTETISGTSTITLSSESSMATVPSSASEGSPSSSSIGVPAESSPAASSSAGPESSSSVPAEGASSTAPAASTTSAGTEASSSAPASSESSSSATAGVPESTAPASSSAAPSDSATGSSSVPAPTSSASVPDGSSTEGSPTTGSGSSSAVDTTSTSSVTLTSTITSTTQVTATTSASTDSMGPPMQTYGSSSLTGIANNATGLTASSTMPSMTSSYVFNPTGGYGGQTSSNTADAFSGTAASTGGMPGMTGNGTLATASPSIQPYTGAAAQDFDTSLVVCMIISFITAMMVI